MSKVPDARRMLKDIRSEILKGCCILFSRIIPKSTEDPQKHPFWAMAVQLGAECALEENGEITHVVAGDHTDKTARALKTDKHVVTTEWLICSGFTWQKADEKRFQLPPYSKEKRPDASPHVVLPPGAGDEAADMAAALAAAGGGKVDS